MAPHDPEVRGLLALLLLLDSRRPARVSVQGELLPLPEQDRRLWNQASIAEGHHLVRECLAIDRPGPYQIQAAIQAVHCDANTAADTDWVQILTLYDSLLLMLPTSAVAVNRAVALGKVHGPEVALEALDAAGAEDHYARAVRADLLAAAGRPGDAALMFLAAARQTPNEAERNHLLRRAKAFGR